VTCFAGAGWISGGQDQPCVLLVMGRFGGLGLFLSGWISTGCPSGRTPWTQLLTCGLRHRESTPGSGGGPGARGGAVAKALQPKLGSASGSEERGVLNTSATVIVSDPAALSLEIARAVRVW
jgi:hypothetical protein